MKSALINALSWILKKIAQLTILKYRPGVIGVTGSVGKTSTKLAIAAVLGNERHVRFSPESHNTEIGFPLAIISEWSLRELELVSKTAPPGVRRPEKTLFWLKVICFGLWQLIVRKKDYPEMLILEYGADRPGDLKKLIMIARPNLGVITAIGDIPVHVEFYSGPDEVAREKSRLVENLSSASFAILNHDDESVMNIKDRTRAHLITFGFTKGSDVRIVNFENRAEANGQPRGVAFKLEYGGSSVPVRLDGVFGRAQAYAAAAAAAVGAAFGVNLIKIAEALKNYKPAQGRMDLVAGIKSTWIIDDSYNASPLSMHVALDTLRSLPAKRKIAVLGDMLEIGQYAMQAHETIGNFLAPFVDLLVTVGPRAKFIAEGARANGFNRKKILSFDEAEDAEGKLEQILKPGDLVLFKASRAMHLEKLVEEVRVI